MAQFFKCVTLCHDCIVVDQVKEPFLDNNKNKERLNYQGQSLDELCLLNMAQDSNIFDKFVERTNNSIKIERGGQVQEYRILKTFKFTSDRKCSSAVIRNPDGEVFVYVKGSEIAIKSMLHQS